MNNCPHCGFENPPGIHICLNCASTIKRKCPKCSAEIPVGFRFCGQCGAPVDAEETKSSGSLPETSASMNMQERMLRDLRSKMPTSMVDRFIQGSKDLYGQRREVTILAVEVSHHSILSQQVDSETIYLAVDEIIHLLGDIVYKYEGTIDKYSGNGMMALFGLPINHENDPERAVRAALEMQYRITGLREKFLELYGCEFQVKIGINSGAVVAGYMNEQQHLEYTVIGDTVHLASTLMRSASPGEIRVSFTTYQRTRPIFEYSSLDHLQGDTVHDLIKNYKPVGLRANPGQVRGLPGLQVPMIGRRDQLDDLIDVFKAVVANNISEIVVCSGEAGIGKSRLVAEFRNYLNAHPVTVVQGTCALYMRITPYRVLADILRNLLGISELDPITEQRRLLQRYLEQLGLDHSDILPYLMHVLGILQSDPVQEVRIKLLDPSMLRRQIHFALRMFIIAESRRSPLVLVFDDLHWVDQSSGQFLEYLCQSMEMSPILLMLVARDFEKYAFAKDIRAAADKHIRKLLEINIQPLDESNAHLLVDQLVHEDSSLAKEMKALITYRAGGNPYYTEELVRILMDHGGLIYDDGNWRMTEYAASLMHEVPGTLNDIILARFDHLPDTLKNILLRASVLGDSFSVRLLQALIDPQSVDLISALIELEEREFLINTKLSGEDGYIFKHPLIQEAIYKTLLKRDSKKLHTQVAQVIQSGTYWLPGEINQVLAYHLSESSKPASAIPYLLISAEKAYQHFANDTVVQLYRQALRLMETPPEPDITQKEKALVGLAEALKFTGELEEAARYLVDIVDRIPKIVTYQYTASPAFQIQIEALRNLADIRAREGNLDYAVQLLKQGMDLLQETGREQYPVIWRRLADRLAWVYFRLRNLDEAYNLADLALMDTATWETEDPITLASLYNTIGGIYWTHSRYAEAIESVEHSLEIYKNLRYHWGMAISLANLGILHYSTENWQQAVEYLEQADRLRQEYGDDPERPTNLKNLGEVLVDLGELDRARKSFETSKELSKRLGLEILQANVEFGLCRLSIVEENPQEARQHLENASMLLKTLVEDDESLANYYQLLVQIELLEGDLEKARNSANLALTVSERGNLPEAQSDIFRFLGLIAARSGEFEQSETYLNKSILLAQKLEDHFSEAKARYEMGVLLQQWSEREPGSRQQRIGQSARSLDAALRTFETLGAQHERRQVEETRKQLAFVDDVGKQDFEKTQDTQTSLIKPSADMPDGEWYQTAIISVLLRPRPGMDDELIFETIAFLIPSLTDLIQENGCQVIRQQDGLMGVFGAPVAREDDLERAVETAMQIKNFYHELDQQTELSVSIHLGVASGKIVAGNVELEQSAQLLAAGEPVKLARAIAEACPPGRVWVTSPVKNQSTFRFEYSPLASDVGTGLLNQPLFQLEGVREQILPVRGLMGLKTPFIGRDKELEEMDRLSRVLSGKTGGIIWIEGDAGIGKSRLMRVFSKQVEKYSPLILWGLCTQRHSEYAFSLFSDLLMQVFEIQYNDTPKQINEQIDRKLALWSLDLLETRPFLQLLLGVQPVGGQADRIMTMEPEQLRRQTFVAIHRLFRVMALQQPLVLILDDLQWIDSISADLLLYLSHLVVSQPILFVCAQRKSEPTANEPVLEKTRSMHPDHLLFLSISPLAIAECRKLLNEFLSAADFPESFMTLIIQQSGGNPYFIEEFVRLLVEQDFLRLVRGQLVANRSLDSDALVVPASLESLIRARVDSLVLSARQLLQIASIIGHRFSGRLLMQVAESENIQQLMSDLHTRGMLIPASEEDYWEFSHPLIEVIVYNSVLRAQRRILHQKTAAALEEQWKGHEEEHAEDLAYHFRKAEIYERALHYLILAGERAAARHANDVAVSFFEQAAELLSAVPNVGDEVRWRIIHQLGDVYQFIGNYDTSISVLQSNLDLIRSRVLSPAQRAGIYRRLGDTAHKKGDQDQAIHYLKQALDVIDVPADTASWIEAALIQARLGWCHFVQSNLEPAREAVMMSKHYAGLANSITTLAMAENYLGGIFFRQGDLEQAVIHTKTAMDYWQEIGYSWGVAAALSNLGILESVSGNWQAAFNSIKRSLELRQKMGDVDGVAITNHNLGHLLLDLGDFRQAESYYRESLAVSRPFQMSWHAVNSSVGLAQSLLYQGRVNDAYDILQDGFRLAQGINAPDLLIEAHCTAAEIQLENGKYADAEDNAQSAAKLALQIGVSPLLATAWRLASKSLLCQGKLERSRKVLEKAWKALEEGPDRLEEGRLHAHAMQVALALNKQEEALTHRSCAEKIFKELGASRDLELLNAV